MALLPLPHAVLLAGLLLPVTFHAPHAVRAPSAALDEPLARSIDGRIKEAAIGSTDELVRFGLEATARDLHFGLAHVTSLKFGTAEREANCIEYAHLFAAIVNRAAARKHLGVRAWVVHSEARVFGEKLPMRGLDDHDWVLVVPSDAKDPRRFVDPTFFDMGLSWDISSSVSGPVKAP